MAAKAEIVPAPAPWVEQMTAANKMLALVADDPFRASRVWDFAEAARVYALQFDLGVSAVNHAVAVKLKAQRLLAEAVDAGQEKGEITTRRTANPTGKPKDPSEVTSQGSASIGEVLGKDPAVARQMVSTARKIRDAFTEDDIDLAAADATLAGEELTSAQMLARAREVAAAPREEYVAADDRVKRARFVQSFNAALPGRVFEFDPGEVADVLTEDEADHARSMASGFADWFARFEKARGGLRVVSGGTK